MVYAGCDGQKIIIQVRDNPLKKRLVTFVILLLDGVQFKEIDLRLGKRKMFPYTCPYPGQTSTFLDDVVAQ